MTSKEAQIVEVWLWGWKKDIKVVTEGTLKMLKGSLQNFVIVKSD